MNEQQARLILGDAIEDYGLSRIDKPRYEYLSWSYGEKDACLDGNFTVEQLEAIAWWMRNKCKGVSND